jgi:hypothetical protein|tara:strand:- start:423 stop:560 length:138 start_codon:yes stop_codon:yes gene_type:complete
VEENLIFGYHFHQLLVVALLVAQQEQALQPLVQVLPLLRLQQLDF